MIIDSRIATHRIDGQTFGYMVHYEGKTRAAYGFRSSDDRDRAMQYACDNLVLGVPQLPSETFTLDKTNQTH